MLVGAGGGGVGGGWDGGDGGGGLKFTFPFLLENVSTSGFRRLAKTQMWKRFRTPPYGGRSIRLIRSIGRGSDGGDGGGERGGSGGVVQTNGEGRGSC